MKQVERALVEDQSEQAPALKIVAPPGFPKEASAAPLVLPSRRRRHSDRPELSVLGWAARFTRLSGVKH